MLVIDNLQWCDVPSLKMLEFLAHELADSRILVIGTSREGPLTRTHPLTVMLGGLTPLRHFNRITLRGFSRADVLRYIERTVPVVTPGKLTDLVYAHTEGNPLFVTEVMRKLAEDGALSPGTEAWNLELPDGVRDVIRRRLTRLSSKCNEMLTVASVIGREFTTAKLAPLILDTSESELSEVLAEAGSARIIEEALTVSGGYRFTHKLIQDAIGEDMSAAEHSRLHSRIASVLERLYGAEADAHADEMVVHYGESWELLGPDKLVHYSRVAAAEANEGGAYEQVIALSRRAIQAWGDRPVNDEFVNLLTTLSDAERELGAGDDAARHALRAFEYFIAEKRPEDALPALIELCELDIHQKVVSTESIRDATRRVLRMRRRGSPQDAKPVQMACVAFVASGDMGLFDRDMAQVLKVGERRGSKVDQSHLLWSWGITNWLSGFDESALRRLERSGELARGHEGRGWKYHRCKVISGCLAGLGRPDEAMEYSDTSGRIADEIRLPRWQAGVLLDKAGIGTLRGEWQTAIQTWKARGRF